MILRYIKKYIIYNKMVKIFFSFSLISIISIVYFANIKQKWGSKGLQGVMNKQKINAWHV